MSSGAQRLRERHAGPQPLILPNVWDPVSARAFADAGFAMLATSSSAVAATLGYRDGETPATEMFAAVARIARSVAVPLTADIEDGYGLTPGELVATLAECGVVGCNLEDSDPARRVLTDPGRQADFLAAVRAEAGPDLVINARVDVFIRPAVGQPEAQQAVLVEAAVTRANRYLAAGADCCYPIVAPEAALPDLVRRIDGPVNALYRPDGMTLAQLAATGLARITFGGGLHQHAEAELRASATALAATAGVRG
ncbi:MAG TPA: isocitrate lyase/phosphoenolpyruvate mutase family protein [Streptosporangiaceae bacterium]|nr:isocitrate lyase/phosphoenolpyruvate mutase family protein [Streptosporangiaceae bacterium]